MTADLAALFEASAARIAERRESFGLAARRRALNDLRRAIDAHRADLLAAVRADLGRPEAETALLELMPLAQEISHARRNLRRWMRPRRALPGISMIGTKAHVVPQARGLCLIIAPWNYPVLLALGPLVSALAAGNAVILKPSELAPAATAVVARLLRSVFPADLVAVAEGGAEVAEGLLALPFDHIFFTGSTAVGRVVMAAAAKTLASVTLELGGKSPAIVGPDADIGTAARSLAWGKFANNGQTCVAPDHIHVHRSIAAPFQAALVDAIGSLFGTGAGARSSNSYARIVNERHFDRLSALLQDAVAQGATLVTGGQTSRPDRFIAPTVLTGIPEAGRLSEEEIFGPILPLWPYDDLDEVIAGINRDPRPLALYLYARDRALAETVIARTRSGTVGVNLSVVQFAHPNLPFGGIGASGQGMAHGQAGFLAFSHPRPVLANRWSPLPLLMPPYGKRTRALIGVLERLVRWLP